MEINSNNLVNKDIFNNNKLSQVNPENLKDEELKRVSDEFESFFLNQIMDVSLRSTDVAGKGAGSDIIKGMYTQTISQSSAGTFGISNMLYEFLSRDINKGK
ncbi:hypothetical protein [Poseidonibacter sp.]|uniref:hypothetical protein n=1 Tax=Poseidonibacter sp. TaxID=2321188 RepID=UPI00359DAEE2